jgi:uncharacterized protein YceK
MSMSLVVLLVCSAVVLQGCASTEKKAEPKAMAPAAQYSWGALKSVEPVGIDKVYDATLKALDELKLPILQKRVDSMSGEIIVRDVSDTKIAIVLTATTDGKTKLAIKVGLLGDEAKSRLIYEQLKKKL